MKIRITRSSGTFLVCLSAAMLIPVIHSMQGATVVVRNTNDNAAGSLRQAIQDATAGDTIVFQIPTADPGYAATGIFTIGLTSGELLINKNLTIDSGGQKISVQRISGSFRLFRVSTGQVTLLALTIRDGQSDSSTVNGGGIVNSGNLTVKSCTFVGNGANVGNIGGAIYNSGTLRVSNCTFYDNRAGLAGTAIYNFGDLTLENSTIAGNVAPASSSDGAAVSSHSSATTRVRNTILVGNTRGSGPRDVAGNFISEGYNLIGEPSGSSGFGVTGDQLGVSTTQANLTGLVDNGGPTQTIRPLPGSVAIDQGKRGLDANNQPINIDQRNLLRPVDLSGIPNAVGGDGSDIGAVEIGPAQSGPNFTVTTSEAGGDGSCTTDHCTFQEALVAANSNADASRITFAPGVTGTIFNFPLTITNPVTINGPGARLLAISASTIVGGRILQVNSSNVVITGLTLTNGVVFNTNGGAISNSGGLTMQDCTIKASSASGNDPVGFGGAIYNGNGATLNLTRCTIRDCTAASYGGGVYNDGNVTATNCTFTNNSGLRGGGMISRAAGGAAIMTLRNCSFTNNTATDGVNSAGFGGGGVYAEGGAQQHFMANCIIAANNATNDRDIRGNYTSQGHNLIGRVGDSAGLVNGNSGDIVGDNTTGINAQFSSFGNNGGPTDTWSLLINSPAINAGDNALAPSTDQRGYPRIGVSDIGAFEFGSGLLRITKALRTGSDLDLALTEAVAGSTYRFEQTYELTSASWQQIPSAPDYTPTQTGAYEFIFTGAAALPPNQTKIFYRVRLLP